MKKKCMAVGGAAKKPATMEEQLAGIRGKVRPGYQAGGPIYRSGNSFTDQQIGEPMKGIASAGMSGQVDSMLDRTKSMPGSIAQAPQPYTGSVIPGQTSQQTMRAATNFGMPPAGPAPTANSQTISTGDYSTGPRQGGFVDEYGKPRTTPAQDAQAAWAEKQDAVAASAKQRMDDIAANRGLSDRQKIAALADVGQGASNFGVGENIMGSLGKPMNQLSNRQQLLAGQAQYGIDMNARGLSSPRREYRTDPRRGYANGGIIDKLIRTVGKILPESSGQKYEPGIQSRAAEDPARHGRAEALNPRTQTAPSETPPAGGFQEEAARRRKQMEEAKNYETGGMVDSEDEDESEDKNKCSIEISIDIPVSGKKAKEKNSEAEDYACGGKVKNRGMASGGMVRFAGKGGPRDDQIPVKVAGQEINVSNGENAVILPAKTAANPAALYAIGGIIQATNDGRKPKMGMEKGGKYASGSMPNDEWMPEGGYLRTPEGRQRVAEAIVNAPSIGSNVSFGGQQPATAQSIYAPAIDALKKGLRGEGMRPDVGIIGPRAAPVTPVPAAQPYSNEGRPSAMDNYALTPVYGPTPKGIAAGVAQPSGAVVNDGMTTTQMGRGFDPTNLQMAPGYGMATNAAGKTIAAGNAEYVGADGQPTSRWTDTQQYKDAIARNQADKLRLAEMQAQRLGADPMAVQKASQGIAQSVMQAPLDARVKQQQIQQGDIAAQNARDLNALYQAHKEAKTPEERGMYEEAIRVRTGKDKPEEFAHASGGMTALGEKTPDVIYSKRTGRPAGSGQQQTSFSKADVDSAIKAGASKEAVASRIKSMGMNPKDYGL